MSSREKNPQVRDTNSYSTGHLSKQIDESPHSSLDEEAHPQALSPSRSYKTTKRKQEKQIVVGRPGRDTIEKLETRPEPE